jgi:formate dehydrogenase major subunit
LEEQSIQWPCNLPGVIYTTFHRPQQMTDVATTSCSDWATNCPGYKVTAVQVSPSNGPNQWQEEYEEFSDQSRRTVPLRAAE